ncbi:MAG: PAS domain S-box protein [Bryobacterales bacterium]|nr:PAS domain S-box protein [Bryobacterales bacterium]
MNTFTDPKTPAPDPDFPAIAGRLLAGNIALGIAYIDRDTVVRFSNPAYQRFLRPGGEPVTGHRLPAILSPARWQIAQPFVETALGGTAVSFEVPVEEEPERTYLQVSYLPDPGAAPDQLPLGFVSLVEDVTPRHRVEAALHESEATLRAVFASAAQGIVAVDGAGRIQFHNQMAETIFGFEGADFKGRLIEELLPGAKAADHARLRESYFASPRTRTMGQGMELIAKRRNGTEFPVEVSLSYVNRGNGQPPLAIAFVSDVSRRRQLEEERNRFFHLSADLNCIAGLDGYFKQINSSFHRVLGWSDEEILSRRFLDLAHPDDHPIVGRALEQLSAGQAVEQLVIRYRRKEGGYRWLAWTAPPPAPGQAVVYATARDVTSERQAQLERQRLAALIEHSSDWIAMASPASGRCQFLNASGSALAGFAHVDDARGAALDDLFDAAELRAALGRGERWRGEVVLRNRATGEAVPLDMNAFAMQSGEETVWAMVARDIRRRKRDQERLQALTAQLLSVQEDERRRIARELHDDVTQKLAMLGIEFGLIHRDVSEANAAEEKRLGALHEQILQLSEDVRQLSHQLHPSVLEHSGLGPALEAYCRDMAKQTGLQISVATRDLPRALPQPVSIGLYRIAQEAVRNVAKHAQARSAAVTLTGSAGAVRLAVIDDGRGYDADAPESHHGLGFVSMQERTRLIDGRLTIESEPGEGTRVVVEVALPAAASA